MGTTRMRTIRIMLFGSVKFWTCVIRDGIEVILDSIKIDRYMCTSSREETRNKFLSSRGNVSVGYCCCGSESSGRPKKNFEMVNSKWMAPCHNNHGVSHARTVRFSPLHHVNCGNHTNGTSETIRLSCRHIFLTCQ
jgi:hypothetical protein